MNRKKKDILIIEDDRSIVQLLEIHLKDLNFNLLKAYDGKNGLQLAFKEKPDLIVLDIVIPIIDGIEVCQKIRAKQNTPIIFLSAKTTELDRVLGLELGADDYVTKPFSVREFTARIKALFRRIKMNNSQALNQKILEFKGLSINTEKKTVLVNGTKVNLSPKEFELLFLMASNPGKNYSRASLLRAVWQYDFKGYEHTVNSHINRLRSKIESNMSSPEYIITHRGFGYKFNDAIERCEKSKNSFR